MNKLSNVFKSLLYSVLFIASLLATSVHAQSQPHKHVLLLYTYGDGLPAYAKATPAFISVMTAAGINANDLFFEYLDLQRNDNAEYRQRLADLLRYKYTKHKIELIVTVHTDALNFLLNEGKELFPDAPVFSYLLVRPELIEARKTRRQILQRPQNLDMKGTLEIALKMFPETRKIVFVTGTASGDRRFEHEARQAFEPWRDKLEFQYTSDRSVEETLQLVANLPPRSVVIYSNVFSDRTGRTFTPREVGKMVAKAANSPVFCLWDTLMGSGVIGGSLMSFDAEGAYAANMVLNLLNGKIVLTKPVTTLTPGKTFMFDWRQLKRWRVNKSIVPKESVFVNRVPSLWEQHKGYAIGSIAVILVLSLLVIGLLIQRNLKRRAEASLRRMTDELDRFFDVSLDLLCIANIDGYFLRLNPAWERTFGYTREELMSKQFLDFVHPDDLNRTREAVSTLTSQEELYSFENRYRCKDGMYRWLQWSAAPAGKLIYAAARDVTDSKLAEEALVERLHFEELLANLSARFVNVTPTEIDLEIEEALRRVADFFRVTNCGLVKASPEKNTAVVTHAAHPAAGAMLQIGADVVSLFPWSSKMLREGGVVRMSRLNDLPTEAATDKETYRKLGVRSILTIPVSIEGSPRYAFSIASRSEERMWPEELIPRLRLVGEIFVNALERKQIRLQIEERLRFERLISNLSAGFLNLRPDEVDGEINKGLRSIAEFFDVDRCTIGLFSEDGTQLVRAFEYHSVEAEPAVESIMKEQMPWYMEQLIRGTPVVMNRIEDLPPEADTERRVCVARGMKSALSIPMISGGKTLGSFVLVSTRAERVWPEELVQRFRSVSQVFTNALQRKQMHREIQSAAEEWQATFDSVQDLVMILDREFKLVRVNVATLSFFNLPLERVVGNYCYALMHGTCKPVETCPLAMMLKTRRHEEAELYDETRKAWFHVSVDPILDDKAEITRVIHTLKNITERKRAEAEAFETRRELLRLERLSRMGELTASLAHELNQPLTSILTNARAALRFIQSNRLDIGELKEILQDIANDDKRAGDIIRNLRAMVKSDEGERESVLINDVLRETVSIFNSEAIMRNLTIKMDFADPLPPVHVNKVQIQQVLVNLMLNAAESMIDTSGNRKVVIKMLETDGGTVKVAVRDFGPGVEEKELDRIFEPFFTTKRSGLGMGLSLSRSIIEAHGGHIWVENNPDRGATFYFDLPVIKKE